MNRALIISPIAPIMLEPNHECELADEALCGMEVQLLETHPDGYYLARTHYNYTGYIHDSHLLISRDSADNWARAQKLVVLSPTSDILSHPKVQGWNIATLTRGGLVSPMGEADGDGWLPVALCDGRRGYARISHLGAHITGWDKNNEAALRAALAATARTFLGTQYRWGGKTPLGIDCSGLTSASYLLNGVIIYRDAHIKPDFDLHEIPRERMATGDLIFFKGHVAMYLGEDRYIHSTGRAGDDGVVINSLNPEHPDYRKDLAEGIRQVGSIF